MEPCTTMATPATRRQRRRRRRGAAAAAGLMLVTFAECLFRGDDDVLLRRRQLLRSLDASHTRVEELDSDAVRRAALAHDDNSDHGEIGARDWSPEKLPPYSLRDALAEAPKWEHTFAVLVYDPTNDEFVGYYSKRHRWNSSCKKLWGSLANISTMLRTTFPERFRPGQEEFVVAMGSGDYPHVTLAQLPHTEGRAPVLMFGSVFRDPTLYPNMIGMPTPGLHLGCFELFARTGSVCGGFRSDIPRGGLVSGEEVVWDDLIPQVIWRGTDFGYLPTLLRPKLTAPLGNHIEGMVENRKSTVAGHVEKKRAATQVLREQYEGLLPRWKGALLTAEAELEAEASGGNQTIPWANIKFSRQMHNGMMAPTKGSQTYQPYDEVGIATGDFLSRPEHVTYKYHIDLGGGGGTTWTGTLDKLAMPGLLFHHVTPTKDYFYDMLEPWAHYVPIAADLSDLKEKYEWAESHPTDAQRIADRATDFVRDLGTPEGFGKLFDEMFRTPLRRVIEAYRPASSSNDGTGKTWREMLEESDMAPVVRCTGRSDRIGSCRAVEGAKDNALHKRLHLPIFVEQNTN